MKYKTPGLSKNKEIIKQRKKPLPLNLMMERQMENIKNETNRTRIDDGRNRKNTSDSKNI